MLNPNPATSCVAFGKPEPQFTQEGNGNSLVRSANSHWSLLSNTWCFLCKTQQLSHVTQLRCGERWEQGTRRAKTWWEIVGVPGQGRFHRPLPVATAAGAGGEPARGHLQNHGSQAGERSAPSCTHTGLCAPPRRSVLGGNLTSSIPAPGFSGEETFFSKEAEHRINSSFSTNFNLPSRAPWLVLFLIKSRQHQASRSPVSLSPFPPVQPHTHEDERKENCLLRKHSSRSDGHPGSSGGKDEV